jgi:hypothetical protein
MLDVPQVGSSHRPDQPATTGIDPGAAGRWVDGLTSTEAWTCQLVAGATMAEHGYHPAPVRPTPLGLARTATALSAKSALAFALNAGRAGNLVEAARRRMR